VIPFGSRVGIGAIAVGAAAASGAVPPAALVAVVAAGTTAAALLGLTSGIAGGARRERGAGGALRLSVGVLVGAWLVVARLAVGGSEAEAPVSLPAGTGPWTARITTMSTPLDGMQRLTVVLDEPIGAILAVTAPRYPAVEPGDQVRLVGRPAAPPEGGYGDFLRRTGVVGTLRSSTLELVGRAADAAGLLERTRRAAGDSLARALPEPAAGLAAGILVGLRDRVDRDLAAAFTATGLSHVVAISGWNIAIVAGLVGALLAGRARRTRSGVILVAIVAYTVLAGASASVVRAAAMTGVALLARETGRPGTAAAALGWAVAALVVANPANALDVGLQLSAAATAGLIAWSAPVTAILERRVGRLPRWVREGLGVSLAAQAATLPLILVAFGRVAPLSPVSNLAVVPLVPLAMATGTVALAGGALVALGGPAFVAPIIGIPGALVLGLMIGIVRLAAVVPLASVTLPPTVAMAAAAGVVVALVAIAVRQRGRRAWAARRATPAARSPSSAPIPGGRHPSGLRPGDRSRNRRQPGSPPGGRQPGASPPGSPPGGQRPNGQPGGGLPPRDPRATRILRLAGLFGALAVAVLVVAGASRPDGRVHVVILDVGQGDAILVTGPTGGRMLVDGGPDPDRLLVALDGRVPPWDRRIDLVVLTHPHEDHVAGLPLILERYRVGRVVEPGMPGLGPGYEALTAILAERGATSGRLAAGDRFALDGIDLDVLSPDAARVPAEASGDGSAVNDVSIVLLGSFEGRRFLLAGDAEAEVEAELVSRGIPTVDLLKAGHHGSRTSTTDALVAATLPGLAAVSVGAKNTFGHPSPEVVARLEDAGAVVLRTDQVGTIDVALGAAGIEVRTERPAPLPEAGASPAARLPGARAGSGLPVGLPYDRGDARPVSRSRRRPPPLARAALVAHPPRARRRGDRGMARRALRRPWHRRRPGARGGGRAPPRRRQGHPAVGPGGRAAPRRRLGRLAEGAGNGRAGSGGRGSPGDAPGRHRGRRVARVRVDRGAPGGLRGQARRRAA
jgi:competence protein ComEC